MKINVKTIVIVIVVGLVAFLFWRKSKKGESGSPDVSGTGAQPGTIDYILANVPFTNAEIRKIKGLQSTVNASTTYSESMRAKAAKNGTTFDEQIVLDAIWLLYHPNQDVSAPWNAGPDGSTTYGWKLQQKVLNLK